MKLNRTGERFKSDYELGDAIYSGHTLFTGEYKVSFKTNLKEIVGSTDPFPNGDIILEGLGKDSPLYAKHSENFHNVVTTNSTAELNGDKTFSMNVYEACHGWSYGLRNKSTFNFYHALHPRGYYGTNFGEIASSALQKKHKRGGEYPPVKTDKAYTLTALEGLEMFGIASNEQVPNLDNYFHWETQIDSNRGQAFYEQGQECPPVGKYDPYLNKQSQMHPSPGTLLGGYSVGFYNGNPTPSSLDSTYFLNSYKYNTYSVKFGENSSETLRCISINDELPVPEKQIKSRLGSLTRAERMMPTNPNSPDYLGLGPTFEGFYYFAFSGNNWAMPFEGTYKHPLELGVDKSSAENHWWKYRDSSKPISFLPWTTGPTILACPSEYFDVPYYAAIGRFGFYGVRFISAPRTGVIENKLDNIGPTGSGDKGLRDWYHGKMVFQPVSQYPGYGYGTGPAGPTAPPFKCNTEYEHDDFSRSEENFLRSKNLDFESQLYFANQEKKYDDYSFGNVGVMMHRNQSLVINDPLYKNIMASIAKGDRPKWASFMHRMQGVYYNALTSINNFLHGADGPFLVVNNKIDTQSLIGVDYGGDVLSDNTIYSDMKNASFNELSDSEKDEWRQLESKYGKFICKNSNGDINSEFYEETIKKKTDRLNSRYLANFLLGQPMDYFPTNRITFSFDSKNGDKYTSIGRYMHYLRGMDPNTELDARRKDDEIRYFEGTYGDTSKYYAQSAMLSIEQFNQIKDANFFYPGSFNNSSCNKELPAMKMNGSVTFNADVLGKKLHNSYGHGDVGKMDAGFSCFTPIFVQNPIRTECKIGQAPVFRALAVDYHTIPEDKVDVRYPEIMFWAKKLKLVDKKNKLMYPVKYSWHRVRHTNESLLHFVTNHEGAMHKKVLGNGAGLALGAGAGAGAQDGKIEDASTAGDWCCLEGENSPVCTLIHPKQCEPKYDSNNNKPYFKKGAMMDDGDFFYFCRASGRFGVRTSEPVFLEVSDNVVFDVSIMNGTPKEFEFKIRFQCPSGHFVEFPKRTIGKYHGFVVDGDIVPEQTTFVKRRFRDNAVTEAIVGNKGWRGALRSYQPISIPEYGYGGMSQQDGTAYMSKKFKDYGQLERFEKQISQADGDTLYGWDVLPKISDGKFNQPANCKQQKGVRIRVFPSNLTSNIVNEPAVIGIRPKICMDVKKLGSVEQLFPPRQYDKNGKRWSTWLTKRPLCGHWQFSNNMGSIKNFGEKTTLAEVEVVTYAFLSPQDLSDGLAKAKGLFYGDSYGKAAGYNRYALGRNMLYFIENFYSFFDECTAKGKKSVKNFTYIAPGIRSGHGIIQYNFLGQPNGSYLKRHPIHGPYAFEWQVQRHNRDRNGNGIPLCFPTKNMHSSEDERYFFFDPTAVYGLHKKLTRVNSRNEKSMGTARRPLGPVCVDRGTPGGSAGMSFGVRSGAPPGIMVESIAAGEYGPQLKEWFDRWAILRDMNMTDYGCTPKDIEQNECFDACMSIRYGAGFIPGGKINFPYKDGNKTKTVRLTHDSKDKDALNLVNYGSPGAPGGVEAKEMYFRGPEVTIDPCNDDGGKEHCNFMTPVINVGNGFHLKGLQSLYYIILAKLITNNQQS